MFQFMKQLYEIYFKPLKKLYKPKFEDKMNSFYFKIHIRKFAK